MKLAAINLVVLVSSVLAGDFFCEPNTIGGCYVLFTDFENDMLGWDCVDATSVVFSDAEGDTEWSCSSLKPGCCQATKLIEKRATAPPNPWQCDPTLNTASTSATSTPPPTTSTSSTSTFSPTTTITIVQ